MRPYRSKRQSGFTLVEMLIAAIILVLIVTVVLVQMSSLYRINRANSDRLDINTIAQNEVESVKSQWSDLSAWTAGTYTRLNPSKVTFKCIAWSNLNNSQPDDSTNTYQDTCPDTTATLKRVWLKVQSGDKVINIYLDIARPT